MKALLQALAIAGAEVVDVCIAVQRGDPDIGRPYKSLVQIEVTDRVHVVDGISDLIQQLRKKGAKRVALQFPAGLKTAFCTGSRRSERRGF